MSWWDRDSPAAATVDKDALMLSTTASIFGGEPVVRRLLKMPPGPVGLQHLMCAGCLFCFQHFQGMRKHGLRLAVCHQRDGSLTVRELSPAEAAMLPMMQRAVVSTAKSCRSPKMDRLIAKITSADGSYTTPEEVLKAGGTPAEHRRRSSRASQLR
eukprot:SAG22_NODE_818_length_7026_cov_4.805399_2_plen_156_part_00